MRNYGLILGLLALSVSAHSMDADRTCDHLLFSREEVLFGKQWLAHHFDQYPSKFSMAFKRASMMTIDPKNTAEDVVSFGSGPDLFTPLINFPLASRIHLVDTFAGWGKGSGNVLWEIVQRARAVHPSMKVRIVNPGFLKATSVMFRSEFKSVVEGRITEPSEEFLTFSFWRAEYRNKPLFVESAHADPLILELEWDAEIFGVLKKRVLIHPLDYNYPEHVTVLNRHLGAAKLSGIVVTGAYFPDELESFVSRLAPHGSAVLEAYSDDESTLALIHEFEDREDYSVELAHLETYVKPNQTRVIQQKLYVVKRVKYGGSAGAADQKAP